MRLNKVVIVPNCTAQCNPASVAVLTLEAQSERLLFGPKESSFHTFTYSIYLQSRVSKGVGTTLTFISEISVNVEHVSEENA